ncbi:hypothetical protein FOA52_015847, partial [Chlamydomonas sp. UWO 241]
DNFWEMGETGPCGPCSEIHYDRIGGRDAGALVNGDDPNVLEIWNNVFIQFNREADGSLRRLPARSIDTGMGLERITSILQDKMSNYATDLFMPFFDEIQRVTGARVYTDKVGAEDADNVDMAYRVVADHIRTLSFAIADGARPGSDGRDFVLRRVLRRAVRYGREVLGAQEGFFANLVDVVVANFGDFFPELKSARDVIYETIREEEASFSRTLMKGIERFKRVSAGVPKGGVLGGVELFLLWDTFGFPVDLTELMCEEHGLTADKAGFERCFEEAKERSRAANKKSAAGGIKFEAEATGHLQAHAVPLTDDEPKYGSADVQAKVLAILTTAGFVNSVLAILTTGGFVDSVDAASAEGAVGVVLDCTSFYAESGGQIYDTGSLAGPDGAALDVQDTQIAAGFVLHLGSLSGKLSVGDAVTSKVDYVRRSMVMPNHTMTHVLNFALRKVLGDHVDQKGSVVDTAKLRFDFCNNGVVDAKKLGEVEDICRAQLDAKLPVSTKVVPLAAAKDIVGLRAVFGEVYPDPVRVVCVGKSVDALLANPTDPDHANYSIEFCGGTHMANLTEAKAFALVSEEGIAKGIRRIVAYTGAEAVSAVAEGERLAAEVQALFAMEGAALATGLKGVAQAIDTAVIPAPRKAQLRDECAVLSKRVTEANKANAAANKAAAVSAAVAAADAAVATGRAFVVLKLDVGSDAKALLEAWIALSAKHTSIAAMFVSADDEKAVLYAAAPDAVVDKLKANEWLTATLKVIGGKGGGKPGVAQGQGVGAGKVDEMTAVAEQFASLKMA